MPYKANADRRHHIPKQRHRVTNWAAYDASLRSRESLLGLDLAVPDHSTLSRRAETLDVVLPRSDPGTKPVHLLVDSTGLRLCGPGEWLLEEHGSRRRRSWRKLHLATDADTGRIVASVLTDHDADDGAQVGPLLDQIDAPVVSVTADGAYDRDDVYAEVAARHPDASVIVPPRSAEEGHPEDSPVSLARNFTEAADRRRRASRPKREEGHDVVGQCHLRTRRAG